MNWDPITVEVIRSGLVAAALEMNRTLVRTAFNPLLYEVQDFGLGIVAADGRLWAEAPGIAAFVAALSDTVRSGIDKLGLDAYRDGDILVVNDPYLTGTHISDTTVYAPIFHEDGLIGFSVVTAHWADIGGKVPGGWSPDTTDVYQEGICFSHQRLYSEGVRNYDLFDLIGSNVRYPRLVQGDLDAQISACRQGAIRVLGLCDRYGAETVSAAMDDVIERTAAATRRRIAELPDGRYEASVDLDSDGVDLEARPRVSVQLTVDGDRLRVSFDGTSPTASGPINNPGGHCAVLAGVKGLLAPHEPTNEGHVVPIEFETRPGLLVTPRRPAPVDSYGYVGVALIELVIRAMSQVMPEKCPANGYQIFGIDLFRINDEDGEPFIFTDIHDGGAGGRPTADGPVLVFAGDGDTRNVPVEVIETRYPLLVERHALIPEMGGAGEFRGGAGVARAFRVLESGIELQTTLENVGDSLAKGLGGGQHGKPGSVILNPGTSDEKVLTKRVSYLTLETGDVIEARSGGGGGWGHPHQREPNRVLDDVMDERFSIAYARAVYRVAITSDEEGNLSLNQGATEELRLGTSGRAFLDTEAANADPHN